MIILPSSAGIYRPVSSGFNPNSISNRLFWLSQGVGMLDSSNNPVTTSGTTVTTWQDQSGNGNHFTGQATYLDATNAGNGNGQGVISHNNTTDYFWRSISLTADFTIFVVQKPTSSIGLPFYDGGFYIGAYDSSSSLSNDNVAGTVQYRQNGLGAGIPNRNDLYAINYNKFKLLTIEGTGVTEYASSSQLRLWDYSGFRQGGQTAEIFWVSRSVTSTERANLENYFMTKYGIVAPYTSLPVSGAALWLDGSRLDSLYTTDTGSTNVTTNAGAIGRWEDLSGNARHATQATLGSRPTWSSQANGRLGLGAVAFNGSSQSMSLSTGSPLAFGNNDFTVEGWFLKTANQNNQIMLSCGNPGFLLYYPTAGNFKVATYGVADDIIGPVISNNVWTHFAVTRASTSLRLFINGTLQNTVTKSYSYSAPSNVNISKDAAGSSNPNFSGQIQNLIIYNGQALYTSNFTPFMS